MNTLPGSSSQRFRSDLNHLQLYNRFVRHWYCECLDQQVRDHPQLIQEAQDAKLPTRFQRNILTLQAYKKANQLTEIHFDKHGLPILGIVPVSYETFFSILASQGIKITIDHKPHHCPRCHSKPQIKNAYDEMINSKTVEAVEYTRLTQVYQDLYKKICIHESQLRIQRLTVTEIRETLDTKTCLVIEDFAGHDSSENRKIYQLVFVIIYKYQDDPFETWTYRSVFGATKAPMNLW